MTLYTKKNGEFKALTKDQIRKMQRLEHVINLQRAAVPVANTLLALAAWLEAMEKRCNRVEDRDLVVAAAPNRKRIVKQVAAMANAIRVLQKGDGKHGEH